LGIATILSDEESRGTAEYLKHLAWKTGINSQIGDIENLKIMYSKDGT
jgi:hypothetical protein